MNKLYLQPTVKSSINRQRFNVISILFFLSFILFVNAGQAQMILTNAAPKDTIDFSASMKAGVGNGAFTGSGFMPSPTSGRLNSNAWQWTNLGSSTFCWSDGNLLFGASLTTTGNPITSPSSGDYMRGATATTAVVTAGTVSTGGVYASRVTPGTAANPILMVQPATNDFTPGDITLRIKNNGTTPINSFDISYNLYVRNDQGVASTFNFSYSTDSVNFTAVSALDYTSTAVADGLGWGKVGPAAPAPSRSTTISLGCNVVPAGSYFYIRWTSADAGGSGSRDELGLDDIIVSATYDGACTAPTVNGFLDNAYNILPNQMDLDFWRGDGTTGTIIIVSTNATLSSDPVIGTTYTANANYGSGSLVGGGYVVFDGAGGGINSFNTFTLTGLAANTTYYFYFYDYNGCKRCYLIPGGSGDNATTAVASVQGAYYFRTKSSGSWNNAVIWESSITGSGGWGPADICPTNASSGINILSGHTVDLTGPMTMDQLTINGNAVLNIASGGVDSLANGSGFDIDIKGTGQLKISTTTSYTAAFKPAAGATINVAGFGKITVGNGGNTAGYSPLGGTTTGFVTWNTNAIFEWNSTATFNTSSTTYFIDAAAGTIPVFRITTSPSLTPGAGTPTTWNGVMEVNSALSLTGTGTKTFRDGIIGTAALTQSSATTGVFSITGTTAKLGGSGAINLSTNGLTFQSGASAQLQSNKTINGGPVTILGTAVFDASTYSISGNASTTVIILGLYRTANANGFSGGAATSLDNTIPAANITVTSGAVDYTSAGSQTITAGNYGYITNSGGGPRTLALASSGVIGIAGTGASFTTGAGAYTTTGSAVDYNGAAQTLAKLNYNILTLSNSGIKSTPGNIGITDSLKISTGTTLSIGAADSVTLFSTATKTARVGTVGGSIVYNTTGKFVVERYIATARKWQLLAVPTSSTQTIRDAWMEGATTTGQNPKPGYGVQITSMFPTAVTLNFDAYTPGGHSMKYYNTATNAYVPVANALDPIAQVAGYFLYVRGDRTCTSGNGLAVPTTLRTIGQLFTGAKSIPVTGNNFASGGNPYASAIDMRNVSYTNIQKIFYVWDPKLAGGSSLGAFQTFTFQLAGPSINNFTVFPGGGSFPAANTIYNTVESGQAFFVHSVVGSAGSADLAENSKTFGSNPVFFTSGSPQGISAFLHTVNPNGTTTQVDAAKVEYDNGYSNAADENDAIKMTNTGENISISSNSKQMVIERRHTITTADTIYLTLGHVKPLAYRIKLQCSNMDEPGLTAKLVDAYTNTSTPIDLVQGTDYNFNIQLAPGSYAADRFKIVFKKTGGGPLPVTITSLSANRNSDGTVSVNWKSETETDMQQYNVERSADGNSFASIASKAPTANNGSNALYSMLDADPLQADNYYRIKALSRSGQVQYSNIVKLSLKKMAAQIAVHPNPVVNKVINIQFTSQPAGTYQLELSNKMGQLVYSTTVAVSGSNTAISVSPGKAIAAGNYQLSIIAADGTRTVQQVAIQ